MLSSQAINSTNDKSSLLVLVCTYNERANIDRLIKTIHQVVPFADILVMDDASPDGTAVVVQKAIETGLYGDQLRLKIRAGKLGLGSAIRDGLHFAIEQGYELVINLDADFSHDPAAIPELLEAMNTPQVDAVEESIVDGQVVSGHINDAQVGLVIGSRYVHKGGLVNCSWKRKLVSKAANTYARMLLGWNIKDCSSAYRCYRVASLGRLPWNEIQCKGYGFLEEILWHLLNSTSSNDCRSEIPSLRVVEVPIVYTERELGSSKISLGEATGTLEVLHKLRRLSRTR